MASSEIINASNPSQLLGVISICRNMGRLYGD
jgi:hypothetical protein